MSVLKEFRELVNGSQTNVGTNQEKRSKVWNKFIEEFPSYLYIEIDGFDIRLNENTSKSGKSTIYSGPITREQYSAIMGTKFGLTKKSNPFIIISNGVIEINGGGRFYAKISNNRVSNLLPF